MASKQIAGYSQAEAAEITAGAVFGQIQKSKVDWTQITWLNCQEAISEMSYIAERNENAKRTVWAHYLEEMDKPENFKLWPALERKGTQDQARAAIQQRRDNWVMGVVE